MDKILFAKTPNFFQPKTASVEVADMVEEVVDMEVVDMAVIAEVAVDMEVVSYLA